ncbi:kinase-like domain-containing protein [Cristinia sonorae]|uniref:Kinase-like domain-containing protein n=1 Tax=Cristinia sonorae TaxID=1940300 RepID=A0A8K0USL2_9AGAR|nr:kinase-like domain-containing protein [Cristinia sonorae]
MALSRLERERQARIRRWIRLTIEDSVADFSMPFVSSRDAPHVLAEIWRLLELPLRIDDAAGMQSYAARNRLRRWSIKLAFAHDILPKALFLQDVKCSADTDYRASGGFADVYCGSYRGQLVAIKRIRGDSEIPDDQKNIVRRDLCRETLLWKNLSHRHVLPFLGVSNDVFPTGTVCMVLPWVSRGSVRKFSATLRLRRELKGAFLIECLDEWVRRSMSSWSVRLTRHYQLYQIATGMAYLHQEGIIHGDLHCGNALVDEDGSLRLTDFGMATIAEATPYAYASKHGGGAVRWTAPELIDPEEFGFTSARPTYASDVYSFALTCMELYTGQKPFPKLTENQVSRRVVAGIRPDRPESSDAFAGMSEAIWYLVTSCWDQSPSARPSSEQTSQTLKRLTCIPSGMTLGRSRPPKDSYLRTMRDLSLEIEGKFSPGYSMIRETILRWTDAEGIQLPDGVDWSNQFDYSRQITPQEILEHISVLPGISLPGTSMPAHLTARNSAPSAIRDPELSATSFDDISRMVFTEELATLPNNPSSSLSHHYGRLDASSYIDPRAEGQRSNELSRFGVLGPTQQPSRDSADILNHQIYYPWPPYSQSPPTIASADMAYDPSPSSHWVLPQNISEAAFQDNQGTAVQRGRRRTRSSTSSIRSRTSSLTVQIGRKQKDV